jgi:hypothetical protein
MALNNNTKLMDFMDLIAPSKSFCVGFYFNNCIWDNWFNDDAGVISAKLARRQAVIDLQQVRGQKVL